jgi:hypothetical protein
MKKFISQDGGVITVWLTLLLTCMLGFVLIVIECIRYNTAESICIQSGKLATMSAMADYEPDIYENYHIFALDLSYGQEILDESILKKNISKYSNMSINPNYLDLNKEVKDVMGCSVKDVKLSNLKCIKDDTDSFINQICYYMKEHKNSKYNKDMYNNVNWGKKELVCSYIMTHFSSYKSPYILGYMKKKYVYEIEYILMGKDIDNDNMKLIKKLFNSNDIDEDNMDIVCSDDVYMTKLYAELLKLDMDLMCKRIQELIIQNINKTYKKNICYKDLVTSVDVEIKYGVEQRATKIYLVNQLIGKKYNDKNIVYEEKFCY